MWFAVISFDSIQCDSIRFDSGLTRCWFGPIWFGLTRLGLINIRFHSVWFVLFQASSMLFDLLDVGYRSAWANFYLVRFDTSLSQQMHFGLTPFVSHWCDSIRVECHRFDSGFTDVAWFGLIHVESCWFHFAYNGTLQCEVVGFVLIPCGSFSFDMRWLDCSLLEWAWFIPICCGLLQWASGRIEIIRCYMIQCGLLRFD